MQDAMFNAREPNMLLQEPSVPYTPWVVRLSRLYPNGWLSGATGIIVNRRWILTARHFVDQQENVREVVATLMINDNELDQQNWIEFDRLVAGVGDVVALHVWQGGGQIPDDPARRAPIDWDYDPSEHIGDNAVAYGLGEDDGTIGGTRNGLRQATIRIVGLRPQPLRWGGVVVRALLLAGEMGGGDSGGPVGAQVRDQGMGPPTFRVVGVTAAGWTFAGTEALLWTPLRQEQHLMHVVEDMPSRVSIVENANSTVCNFTPSGSNA